jgi:hypothetical protein
MTTETPPQVLAAASPVRGSTMEPPPRVPLGEELPIFCERCGYSLHGLPQARCERCTILHFACPECNHHQPINTVRPAFQRILGRVRAFVLLVVVLLKLNVLFWPLFGWGAFGYEWSYEAHGQVTLPDGRRTTEFRPRPIDELLRDEEVLAGLTLFALAFGIVARAFLFRWPRGLSVGAALGALTVLAFVLGALYRQWEHHWRGGVAPSPFVQDFWTVASAIGAFVTVGAAVAWPLWGGFVRLVMPRLTAEALLAWQRGVSQGAATLARE